MRSALSLAILIIRCIIAPPEAGAQVPHEHLPLASDLGWEMEDAEGATTTIAVASTESLGGRACYRVEWSAAWSDGDAYQSEGWCPTEEGVVVVYKGVGATRIDFDRPYLMLARPLEASTSWSDTLLANGNVLYALDAVVAGEEDVQTPAGDYRAIRVTLRVRGAEIDRWYARGVGMVREATYAVMGDERVLFEDKRLTRQVP